MIGELARFALEWVAGRGLLAGIWVICRSAPLIGRRRAGGIASMWIGGFGRLCGAKKEQAG